MVQGMISPPAHVNLHVLLCLGSCCQDVIYFGVSHERYQRALTCLVTQPISRFYCKSLPGRYSEMGVPICVKHAQRMCALPGYVCDTVCLLMSQNVLQREINQHILNSKAVCVCVSILRGGQTM